LKFEIVRLGIFDIDLWYEIWVTITRNKVRSLLTGFGVFWGIFMLVIMLGSGQGLRNGIMREVEGFATTSAFFFTERTSKPYKGFRKNRRWDIHNRDVEAIRQNSKYAEHISPFLFGGSSEGNVVFGDNAGSYNVRGLYPNFAMVEKQRITAGRFINDVDILHKRKVCVIGTRVSEEMFKKGEDPIGQILRVRGIYFRVVGVGEGVAGVNIGGRSSEAVSVPFTTFQQAYNFGDRVHWLAITTKKGEKIEDLEAEVGAILRQQNKIDPTDTQAVSNFNIEKQFKMFDMLFLGINMLVWIVGMGTLFAGIVGVSNIMLVTVRERTREIGVRRALGATPVKILGQVLTESVVLTALAGLVGLVCGVALLDAVSSLLGANPSSDTFFQEPSIKFGAAIQATVVLLMCGLLAGVIPAWRALKIKAIDAIREE
jgi:putative ABC transport system permease protein